MSIMYGKGKNEDQSVCNINALENKDLNNNHMP